MSTGSSGTDRGAMLVLTRVVGLQFYFTCMVTLLQDGTSFQQMAAFLVNFAAMVMHLLCRPWVNGERLSDIKRETKTYERLRHIRDYDI